MLDSLFQFRLICLVLVSSNASTLVGADERVASIERVVVRSFEAVHNGWSSDEVLLQDELNRKFIACCHREVPQESVASLNWKLLNLRKAGKLRFVVTQRRRDDHESYRHLAEIAARTVQDKHRVTTDRIMCDETMRREFDAQARLLASDTEPYLMRKAAFGLRKNRRLRPELILRIADWGRQVSVHEITEVTQDISIVPETPGIYIFRDPSGYLYIGESNDLRTRLEHHLDQSDRKSLASYLQETNVRDISIELHAFPPDSRANQLSVRRAYESALIASRKPRFNLRP